MQALEGKSHKISGRRFELTSIIADKWTESYSSMIYKESMTKFCRLVQNAILPALKTPHVIIWTMPFHQAYLDELYIKDEFSCHQLIRRFGSLRQAGCERSGWIYEESQIFLNIWCFFKLNGYNTRDLVVFLDRRLSDHHFRAYIYSGHRIVYP